MRGLEMIRINHKRMFRERSDSEETVEEAPKTPRYWYNEYTKYPHLYFANEAEQKAAIAEVMQEWRTGVGRWRFALMDQAAKKIQSKWLAGRPELCEVCNKEAVVYVDKYESCVCENCMNGMCKRCKKHEATPGSGTDECLNCYYAYTFLDEIETCKLCRQYEAKRPGNFCDRCYELL